MTTVPVTADLLRARVRHVVGGGTSAIPDQTVDLLFDGLGSSDPEVRDDLALGTLAGWIIEDRSLPAPAMVTLHRRARGDDGLFHRIGDQGTDTVFRRSFSALLLAVLYAADNAETYLADDDWHAGATAVTDYAQRELDVRAAVPGKGWAHAVAHTADVADEIARSPRCEAATASRLLDGLLRTAGRAEGPFDGEEEDRVAVALATMLERHLVDVAGVAARISDAAAGGDTARVNGKAIVRSLYFRVPDPRDDLVRLQADLSNV